MVSSWEWENINLTIQDNHFHFGTFSLVIKNQVKFHSFFLFSSPWGRLHSWSGHLVYMLFFTWFLPLTEFGAISSAFVCPNFTGLL